MVSMASISASCSIGGAAYAAGEGRHRELHASVAPEIAARGVRINCVSPGFMRTPMSTGERYGLSQADQDARIAAMGRVGAVRANGAADRHRRGSVVPRQRAKRATSPARSSWSTAGTWSADVPYRRSSNDAQEADRDRNSPRTDHARHDQRVAGRRLRRRLRDRRHGAPVPTVQRHPRSPRSAEILEVARFEGQSDPDDEAAAYALQCVHCGAKGILVTAYGPSSSAEEADIVVALEDARRGSG